MGEELYRNTTRGRAASAQIFVEQIIKAVKVTFAVAEEDHGKADAAEPTLSALARFHFSSFELQARSGFRIFASISQYVIF